MASRPETIEKMHLARKLKKDGLSIDKIAVKMGLSKRRVEELIEGINWDSKKGKKIPID